MSNGVADDLGRYFSPQQCCGQVGRQLMIQVLGQLIKDGGDTLQQNEGQEGRQFALHVDGQDCFDNIERSVKNGSDEQHCIGQGGPHTPLHLLGQAESAMIFKLQQYFGHVGRQCV